MQCEVFSQRSEMETKILSGRVFQAAVEGLDIILNTIESLWRDLCKGE